ncbi:MAG: hypothetical protein PHE06_04690, partial [Lachnospiraceae bacterium]|nr:hypothetical protein [Lachnospiraceae bacterium]
GSATVKEHFPMQEMSWIVTIRFMNNFLHNLQNACDLQNALGCCFDKYYDRDYNENWLYENIQFD